MTGSTIKTFQLKNQQKPSCKSEFPFFVVVVVVVVVDITWIEYFLSIFLSSFIKIFEKLWKWFEFIHYPFLVNNTCVSTYVCMANTLIICMLKEYMQMGNWFYLANPPIMMFVGSALEPGIILYTSHFFFGVLCVRKFYLGDPQ